MKEVTIGIDIGGTNTVAGIVDSSGSVLAKADLKTSEFPVVGDYVDALAQLVNQMAGITEMNVAGVGIGAPNANFYKGTIELAPNLLWKGIVPLAQLVESKLGFPVKITNDANAAALGEMLFGGAKGMRDFVVLTLGTGLGSGIVVNGEVVYGRTGFAGEYGHVIMYPGGRDCGCGRQGCLETYVSASGLVRTVQWLLSEMRDESVLRTENPGQLTSRQVSAAALQGDTVALQALDYTAEVLACAIVNIVSITSPEAIFLFGGLVNAGKLLFDPLNSYIEEMIQPVFKGSVKVLPSGVPESNAAIIGAAALAWNYLSK